MSRNEYREGNIAVRDYKITLCGVPLYTARFTSTNRDAIRILTPIEDKTLHIHGFTNNKEQ